MADNDDKHFILCFSLPYMDSLKFIYSLIILGDSSTLDILQKERKSLREKTSFLKKFICKLNNSNDSSIPRDKHKKKKFKLLFIKLIETSNFSDDPVNKTENSLTILSCISVIFAYYRIIYSLQTEIIKIFNNIVGGSTLCHIQLLQEYFMNKSRDYSNEFSIFIENYLSDALQEKAPDILIFYTFMKDKLFVNIDYNKSITWTSNILLFLSNLQAKLVPIPLPINNNKKSYVPRSESCDVMSNNTIIRKSSTTRRSVKSQSKYSIQSPRKMLQNARRNRTKEEVENKLDISDTIEPASDSPIIRKRSLKDLMKLSNTQQPIGIPFDPSDILESENKLPDISIRTKKKSKNKFARLSGYFTSPTQSSPMNVGWSNNKNRNISLLHNPGEKVTLKEADDALFLSLLSLNSTDKESIKLPNTARSTNNIPVERQKSLPRKRVIARCNGYWIEEGHKNDLPIIYENLDPPNNEDEDSIAFGYWFNKFFPEGSYLTYISKNGPDGNTILNIKHEKDNEKQNFYRVLYRTSDKTIGLKIPLSQFKVKILGKFQVVKKILYIIDPLITSKTFQKADIDHKDLVELESLELVKVLHKKEFKIGLLNWKETNKNEEDMFSNSKISQNFDEFMNVIGNKIQLKDWHDYTGGLDTSIKLGTGEYSLFTKYEDSSIMFHVAPFLPFSKSNRQQLERKRHIGNDIVLIVFNEASKPYLTSLIASQFNHVIIVVSPEIENGKKYYSVAITAKESVPTFGPPLPENGRFYSTNELYKFLLKKVINAEKAASHAPAFLKRLCTSRSLLISDIIEKNYINPTIH